ncbi:hypothetical protein [Streptomyces sp. NPDC054887]
MLLKHLPRDSAVARELHGEAAEWSVSEYLLATAVDQLAESNWMFATVNRDEESEPLDYPTPVPRPGAEPDAEEPVAEPESPGPSPAQLATFFG